MQRLSRKSCSLKKQQAQTVVSRTHDAACVARQQVSGAANFILWFTGYARRALVSDGQ